MAPINLWYTVAAVAVLYFIVNGIQSFIRQRQFRRFARDHDAELPKIAPYLLPFGIDRLWRLIRAARGAEDIYDDIFFQAHKDHGRTFVSTGLGGQGIITCEPKNIQAILATQFDDFYLGPRRKAQFGVLLGNSIFSSDGPAWAHARAMFRPMFSRSNINDLEETENAVKVFLDVLPKGDDGWTSTADIQPLFYRFTMDTATAFIFGKSVESQAAAASPNATGLLEFSNAFSVAQEWLTFRILMQSAYFLVDGKRYRKARQVVRQFADGVINMALQGRLSVDQKESSTKYSVVEELTKATKDPTEIRDQVIALMAAGRDTTSSLLSWIFYYISIHPQVFNKLRQSIINDFGHNYDSNKKIDFTSLKSCKYLQYVISESLRLSPVVPVNLRMALRDTTLPVGGGPDGSKPIPVRKGQNIGLILYAMYRDTEIWGDDADQFKPERFENRKSDWSFVPFSGGPRICIGQQYAITEASYLIVRFLQTFDAISWEGPPGKPKKGMGLTLFPKNGTIVRMRYARMA